MSTSSSSRGRPNGCSAGSESVAVPNPILRFERSFALFWDFVGSVLAGALIGYGLDRWFDTEPYWTLGLLILGVVGGFVRLVSALRRMDRMDDSE